MKAAPPWLSKTKPVLHAPTGSCFMPVECKGDDWQVLIFDALNRPYPAEQCQSATLDSFSQPRSFITSNGKTVLVAPHEQGLLVTFGQRRKLVRIPKSAADDEALEAARSLAQAFDGVIVEDVDL